MVLLMTYALLEILCDLTLSWNCSYTIQIASHAKLVSSVTSIFARNLAQGGIFCRLCFVAWAIIISLFKIFIRRRYNINSVGEIMSAMIACIFILWKVIQSGFILLTFASKIYQITQKTPNTHFRQKRGHTRLRYMDILTSWYLQIDNDILTLGGTSLPYFEVKLSCVCLMFAYRKK